MRVLRGRSAWTSSPWRWDPGGAGSRSMPAASMAASSRRDRRSRGALRILGRVSSGQVAATALIGGRPRGTGSRRGTLARHECSEPREDRTRCQQIRSLRRPRAARARAAGPLPARRVAAATGSTSDGPGHGQDPARERAPPRRRRHRPRGGRRDARRLAARGRGRGRDPVHARARDPPGLHRRPRRRRPGRDARRDGRPRRRPGAGQPARPGGPRHRPLGPGRPLRHARAPSPSTSSASTSATASATSSCAGRRRAFRDLRVVPPGTGIVHQVNLEFLATVVADRADDDGGRSPSRTRSSAPTRTPR